MHDLPTAAILRLTRAGILTANTVEYRIRDGQLQIRHATKGWRSRSVRSLQALGLLG